MQPSSSEESTTSTTTTATTTTTTADNYNLLSAYDFASDQEFRNGLGIILGHPGHTASDEEVISKDDVVLQAKCFYISRFVVSAPFYSHVRVYVRVRVFVCV